MDADGFLADLEATPAALHDLAAALRGGLVDDVEVADIHRVVFTGMGSSRFAALPVAAWLRARGIDAVAEYASLEQPHPGGSGTLVVGVSASGSSPETVASLAARRPGTRRVAVTNKPGTLVEGADHHLGMHAGEERGGVACRSFRATVAVLLALAARVVAAHASVHDGRRDQAVGHLDVAAGCERAAQAAEDLLERRDTWLPPTMQVLAEHPASYLIAPAERRSSAEQAALMLREGPRRQADAAETGDWCHVDVYLTLPLAYRGLLFTGSRFDRDALDWLEQRGSRMVAVGDLRTGGLHDGGPHDGGPHDGGPHDGGPSNRGDAEHPAADSPAIAHVVRYRHDHDPLVALLVEVLVAELVAARFWQQTHRE